MFDSLDATLSGATENAGSENAGVAQTAPDCGADNTRQASVGSQNFNTYL